MDEEQKRRLKIVFKDKTSLLRKYLPESNISGKAAMIYIILYILAAEEFMEKNKKE